MDRSIGKLEEFFLEFTESVFLPMLLVAIMVICSPLLVPYCLYRIYKRSKSEKTK